MRVTAVSNCSRGVEFLLIGLMERSLPEVGVFRDA
jgi:hypothetical protein